ncbi:hypothetical protein F8388_014840 [Cannabis sativa]|uniref:non-specific serine/threonine protein kinase n=1 Tax=Cannabis sativa TaxID=3483 RepID=A0A7J6F5Y2_CANSA|nr:hypothetical protein F8388_014840 [Cannabis sativa]KAF4395526.1 hypothetical protein G4B88_010990 [Cannabis sativa]
MSGLNDILPPINSNSTTTPPPSDTTSSSSSPPPESSTSSPPATTSTGDTQTPPPSSPATLSPPPPEVVSSSSPPPPSAPDSPPPQPPSPPSNSGSPPPSGSPTPTPPPPSSTPVLDPPPSDNNPTDSPPPPPNPPSPPPNHSNNKPPSPISETQSPPSPDSSTPPGSDQISPPPPGESGSPPTPVSPPADTKGPTSSNSPNNGLTPPHSPPTPKGYYGSQVQQQQQSNFGNNHSGPADSFYGSQGPNSYISNSHGSQRGNAVSYGGGGLDIGGSNAYFSYEDLMEITNSFSRQNVLGEGGFGCVYKGWLPDGRIVAVKELKAGSGQGEREFKAEVEIISRVHHRHLVSLVGYCIDEHHRLLVYEFVPNQTLEHHLHAAGLPVLDWAKRLRIALGAAKGLAYLHEDCHPKIIHRDIKSANILIDDAFEAQASYNVEYMAPEYASSGKLTDRSDVFSFGVVLLELITGRKPVDPTQPLGDESLVEWARPLLIEALQSGDLSKLVDPRLERHYVESEMIRMVEAAAACVRHSAPKRPRMAQVARALDCEGEMSDLSNGVKYGQSTIYESGQYNQDIMRFRKMALGGGDSSEYDTYSGEFNSKEFSGQQKSTWRDGSSGESETRAFTEQRYSAPSTNFGNRQY